MASEEVSCGGGQDTVTWHNNLMATFFFLSILPDLDVDNVLFFFFKSYYLCTESYLHSVKLCPSSITGRHTVAI